MFLKDRVCFTDKIGLFTRDNGILATKDTECYFMKVGIASKALLWPERELDLVSMKAELAAISERTISLLDNGKTINCMVKSY